ncbi:MAG: tyrosine recombinase XerC [Clostridia bacterium]|nr:tyrosine recombinase XerC [Clostridia bacterium]
MSDLLKEAPPILREWLVYLQTIQGKADKTVESYFLDLRLFLRFVMGSRRGLDREQTECLPLDEADTELLGSVTADDIYAYLIYCSQQLHNNQASRARKLCALRSLFRYYEKQGRIASNPTKLIDAPKRRKVLPKFLNLEESRRLLEQVGGKHPKRDYAILTLFLNCGMRLAELVALNLGDVDFENLSLVVTGKGDKQRTLYLNPACVAALQAYLTAERKPAVGERALFIGVKGQRIGRQAVQNMVKKNLAAAGLEGRSLSTHKLRHTAATLMYQYGGVDTRTLQEILGHEQLNTTQIYTHVSNTQVRDAFNANPLAKEKGNEEKG